MHVQRTGMYDSSLTGDAPPPPSVSLDGVPARGGASEKGGIDTAVCTSAVVSVLVPT